MGNADEYGGFTAPIVVSYGDSALVLHSLQARILRQEEEVKKDRETMKKEEAL
jgi:hypothetical protein